jgi:hypothetical protein
MGRLAMVKRSIRLNVGTIGNEFNESALSARKKNCNAADCTTKFLDKRAACI